MSNEHVVVDDDDDDDDDDYDDDDCCPVCCVSNEIEEVFDKNVASDDDLDDDNDENDNEDDKNDENDDENDDGVAEFMASALSRLESNVDLISFFFSILILALAEKRQRAIDEEEARGELSIACVFAYD